MLAMVVGLFLAVIKIKMVPVVVLLLMMVVLAVRF